jgi:signal transduction histidine kinase
MAERLHDGPLQLAAALRLKLKALESKGLADQGDLAQLTELAVDIQEELASLVRILADPQIVEQADELSLDLSARLRKLCASFRTVSGIDCQLLVIPAHTRLPLSVGVIVYRAINELLTNARKHSQAENVEVASTIRDDGSVVFSVRDDGVGLTNPDAPWQVNEGGFGLWSIVHRLREIGGFLETENSGGVCFYIVLPARIVQTANPAMDAKAG